MEKNNGIILKSIGGLYVVKTPNGIFECKAKGIFRLMEISPYTGDFVEVEFAENTAPVISAVKDRKNDLVRPPLANLDAVVIVVSVVDPKPNACVIDKLITILETKNIEPMIVFTKTDRKLNEDFFSIYSNAGFRIFYVDNTTGKGADLLSKCLSGKTSALIGNSGVGKSSLLNVLLPELSLATAVTSKKLGRGRHTTRHVELYEFGNGYIADTPGFSTVEAARYGACRSEALAGSFREFIPYLGKCPFNSCTHTGENECAVKSAVERGEISNSRYNSFLSIYKDLKTAENTF